MYDMNFDEKDIPYTSDHKVATDLVQVPQQEEVVFEEVMFEFGENLINAQKDIDTDIKQLIDDHFFDLFK